MEIRAMLAMRKILISTQDRGRFAALAAGLMCVAVGWNLMSSGLHGPTRCAEAYATSLQSTDDSGLQQRPTLPYRARNIEDIRVGQRVVVDLPDEARTASQSYLSELTELPSWDFEEVDSATWRRLELTMPDEEAGRFDMVLLRPVSWIEETGATEGGSVYLALPEQGLAGSAGGVSLGPCPPIQSGPG